MTLSSWPFNEQEINETQFSQWATMLHASGVPGATDFVVTAGTGLQLNVAAGPALVRGYAAYDSVASTITLDAASTANPRIDRVVLELNPTTNSITVAVVKGTAASSPTSPTLTQTVSDVYQFPLARVAVAKDAVSIVLGNITDERVLLEQPFEITIDEVTDATTLGKALVRAVNAAAARTAIGATTVGAALLQATTVTAAREELHLFKGTGPGSPSVDDLRYRDA